MKITQLEFTIASIPYLHRESSFQVQRDGVTEVIVKATTDTGLVGWGESCSGADVKSVLAALEALRPFVLGREPWSREAMWHDGFQGAAWTFREGTYNFAWAGIDTALWDVCGQACGQPLYRLLGGARRSSVNYFYYLPTGTPEVVRAQCQEGRARGFSVFYMKVGVDLERELACVAAVRETVGPAASIRIDANQAWSVAEAVRNVEKFDRWNIDFVEQPVPADPIEGMIEFRRHSRVALTANEGLWRRAEAWRMIRHRACDHLCFSPFWVGTLSAFHRLAVTAGEDGIGTCKHTHGEFGLAAAACHHVLLTLPRETRGHQQTHTVIQDDILRERLPIMDGPDWGLLDQPGLGVTVDEAKLARYNELYQREGQFLPYQIDLLKKAWVE